MSARVTVWGIPCPGHPGDERQTLPYRAWYWLYSRNQRVRHLFGLHQRQRHYSIAPRCDWCGHRLTKQRAPAARNARAAIADPRDYRDDATAIGDSTGYGGPVGGGGL